jgi:hypothetical protein
MHKKQIESKCHIFHFQKVTAKGLLTGFKMLFVYTFLSVGYKPQIRLTQLDSRRTNVSEFVVLKPSGVKV